MFQKKCERRDSMGCIVRTYFRGGLVSIRTRSVPSKFYKKYVAKRGGNPPHRGRGVPKKTPHTHLAHLSPIAQLSLASRIPSFCSPVNRGAVAKRLRGFSIHSTPQLRLLGVGLNYETKLLMARGCIYASEVDSINVPFQVYLRIGRID